MKIDKLSHVSMDYTLTLESGEVVDKSDPEKPIDFICGYNQIIPGLEKGLMGQKANSEPFQVEVSPEDAYGERQDELIQKVPLTHFPQDVELKVGMSFQSTSEQGMPFAFLVKSIEDEAAIVDLNHPLAGKNLIFEVVIKSVREATQEEIDAANAPSCNSDNPSECGGGCSCG